MQYFSRSVSKYFLFLALGFLSLPLAAETTGTISSDTTNQDQHVGNIFTIKEGGNATFTSKQSIRLLPGTMVLPGGHLLVKITATGKSPVTKKKKQTEINPVQTATTISKASIEIIQAFKIYPVPEPGSVTGSSNCISGILPYQLRGSNPDDLPVSKKVNSPSDFDPILTGLINRNTCCTYGWGENPANIRVLRV